MHAAFFALRKTAQINKGVYLPNIPYYGESCPNAEMSGDRYRIVFVGQLEYQPNKEGLDYFLEQ